MPDRPSVDERSEAFWSALFEDPFSVRGPHETEMGCVVRAFLSGARGIQLIDRDGEVLADASHDREGLFIGRLPKRMPYRLRIQWDAATQETEDPYAFGPILGETDLYLFSEGSHWQLADKFGAVPMDHEGVAGVAFAIWAPNARRVSVVGDFNSWDGRRHPMRLRREAGVWEIFIPGLTAGEIYKYEIATKDGTTLPLKADPIARQAEHPPATASIVSPSPDFAWHDDDWMTSRAERQTPAAPIAIYEVHAPSWMRPEGATTGTLSWDGLAERLIPYVRELGFTHIELLPIMEHPFSGSWGYQPLSQFAPTARLGTPAQFARFVDTCHRAGIGVILDWVPAHFPNDTHGLARFDGSALYEHTDPREGFHPDWNTCVFNLGRSEVQGFLIASALWWLEHFHVDGIRVDAVASMLYRDYSRKAGEWIPNQYGGRENLEAIAFLRRLNTIVAERCPGAITIAEESTAWPGVTAPVEHGGLGFSYKWTMGWMNDTLRYIGHDPIHRRWHHHDWTFGLLYAFSERYVLPLSHDEVVHGKGSLYQRVPGDPWQKLATLRAYFAFMWTHPGKKLLFMGGEFAMPAEWNHDGSLPWHLLHDAGHGALKNVVADLNRLYAAEPSLHRLDADPNGFAWIVNDDADNSVFAYARFADDAAPLLVIVNMTPVVRASYRLGVPRAGRWREIFNTDASPYGGSNVGNSAAAIPSQSGPLHGHEQHIEIALPPLGTLIFKFEG
jgi:1,4-alpha-glucan branching enzyme